MFFWCKTYIIYVCMMLHCGNQLADFIHATVNVLTLSPLSSHIVGSPELELPDITLFVTVFSGNFQADISSSWEYIKDLQASISAFWEFVTVGEASFSAFRGERVKTFLGIIGLIV